ncbi:MAG: 16S rRNA (cytosine(967)-C(5))-methyltransferase RsmB [Deltaproteobacteria bacterium]|nr:16S rRNA (cytosine(967)-C(5))-methyltransferase RsmB [Deltaproteobacteria bacterium]MBW1921275.1 16S rRNA (cytosine(967)-C(5))-methyltransferase RsmB [Deltaproteobacteria bacterium]MBW1935475.1 16S rRNA (cytosine(967)-C(5))-methyltransferase RsmB [Deltaproteobacteria bacterium]
MKPETPRDLALRILTEQHSRAVYSADALNAFFESSPYLDERDKAFTTNLVQGVLRWRLRLDWIIEQFSDFSLKKVSPRVLNILRLALYQILFLDRVPDSAAVNEAVMQVKKRNGRHVVSYVNAVLRNVCRRNDQIFFPDRAKDPVLFLSVYYSYPEWIVNKWLRELGVDFTERLLAAGNRVPVTTIRANRLRLSRESLIRHLEEEGVRAQPTAHCPAGLFLEDLRGRVDLLQSFSKGFFQVQDQAAQICSFLLSPHPGDRVLDVCAGYGGKTTHLAELMGDIGLVIALDLNHRKLLALASSAARLGIQSINQVVADASKSLSFLFAPKFDLIMVDAPCSGLGVISRHPDAKWKKKEEDIPRLAEIQKKMLHAAFSVLRQGRRMLYITCTISREENEGVVEHFLASQNGAYLEDLRENAPEWAKVLIDANGFFRTFPHVHQMDGFFGALFVRR